MKKEPVDEVFLREAEALRFNVNYPGQIESAARTFQEADRWLSRFKELRSMSYDGKHRPEHTRGIADRLRRLGFCPSPLNMVVGEHFQLLGATVLPEHLLTFPVLGDAEKSPSFILEIFPALTRSAGEIRPVMENGPELVRVRGWLDLHEQRTIVIGELVQW